MPNLPKEVTGDGGPDRSGSIHSLAQLMPTSKSEFDTRKPFSGSRALVALAIGCALGAAVAYFLKVLIENTPAEIDSLRLRLFYLMVITSGGLGGFAIESMRQLQEDATDPMYRHQKTQRVKR
jgi:hypothetical protein